MNHCYTIWNGRERSCQTLKSFSPKLNRYFFSVSSFKDFSSANCMDKIHLIFLELSAPVVCLLCGPAGNGIKKLQKKLELWLKSS